MQALLNPEYSTATGQGRNSSAHYCRLCKRSYASRNDLVLHARNVHKTHKRSSRNRPPATPHGGSRIRLSNHDGREGQEYRCEPCCKVFRHSSYLKRHTEEYHDVTKTIKCTKCPAIFQIRYLRSRHMKDVHEMNTRIGVKCEICLKVFSTKYFVQKHLRDEHNEISSCNFAFTRIHHTFGDSL